MNKLDRKDIDDVLALTPMQEGMLYHYLKDPGISLYLEQLSLDIAGEIDKTCFEHAWNFVVETNEMLRAVFRWEEIENPVQIILKKHQLKLKYYDFSDRAAKKKKSLVEKIKTNDRKEKFCLKEVPFRVTLGKTAKDKYVMIVSNHHILYDGWSTGIILKEFFNAYNDLSRGKELIKPVKTKFKEFIECIPNHSIHDQENFWINYLYGFDTRDEFFIKKAGLKRKPDGPRNYRAKFSRDLNATLEAFAKGNKITPAAVLYSAWGILLQKYNNCDDVVFGTTISGRNAGIKGIENMVGLFINTLPLRVRKRTGTKQRILNLLREVYAALKKREQYESSSLARIKSYTGIDNREEIFDSIVVIENYPLDTGIFRGVGNLRLNSYTIFERTNYDLTLTVTLTGEIGFHFNYNSELFSRDMIKRLSRHFIVILQEVIDNPGKEISEIDILSREEKRQLLYDFNETYMKYPGEKTIQGLFAGQAQKTPDRVALVGNCQLSTEEVSFVEMHLSYRELNEKSAQLAGILRKKGVKPDTIVRIMMERSLEMIAGILGILKAGGAYLPIDPDYPEERINYILKDSSAKILLTSDAINRVPTPHQPSFHPSTLLPFYPSSSSNLAYIIYTSGSTGKPKGVLVEQASVVNLLMALHQCYPLTGNDTFLLKTSYLFDVSVAELFGWIPGGGRLSVLEPGGEKNPLKILDTINTHQVTHINFVPSMFNAFVDHLSRQNTVNITGLKYIFLAGEVLSPALVKKFNRLNTGIRLENLYGPTEATVYASGYSLFHWSDEDDVPIGKPLQNVKLYILAGDKKLVPIGSWGELYIGGKGVARGYLNNPQLTAEKFDQDGNHRSYRSYETYILYKTGDLARWLPDGNIEFGGRIDLQVKIRGFRIELEEIESRLLTHEQIKEAVVTAREDNQGSSYLCAYVVSIAGTKLSPPALREYLSKSLPGYMLPAYFIMLDKMPLTPAGKVERKSLPDPLRTLTEDAGNQGTYTAPRNELEEKMAGIWAKLLGRKNIGINENFFSIGGDSIKAIQIVAKMKKAGLHLPMEDIFRYPQISALANRVKKVELPADQSMVTGIVPLTPIQKWFFTRKFIRRNHFNQAVMLYRKEGFAEEILKKVFTKITEHHDALRMVFEFNHETGKNCLQRNRGTGEKLFDLEVLSFENIHPRDLLEKEIQKQANRLQQGINLKTGPLLKSGLFKTPKGDHLLIVIHHLVVDGISWRILLEDFTIGYHQGQRGEEIKFQEKTGSFKHWAERLNDYAADSSNKVLKESSYWKEIENTKIQHLQPPGQQRDIKKKKNKYSDTVTFRLDNRETGLLLRNANQAYHTEINDILLTALGLALKQWAGLEKIRINLEGHGREPIIRDVDISRTLGWFTAQYPVVLDMSSSQDLSSAIKNVKETLRHIPNKGIGYGILKYLAPAELKKGFDFKPEPEISFNYMGEFQWEKGSNKDFMKISWIGTGCNVSPETVRNYILDINGIVVEGRLELSFNYNTNEYHAESIEHLSAEYKFHLLKILEHCTRVWFEGGSYTPSDFPLAAIDQQTLDDIVKRYRNEGMEIEDIYSLSPSQQGMIFHHLYSPGSSVTVEQQVFKIGFQLDLTAFRRAWQVLLNRCSSLRASFHCKAVEKQFQVIHRQLTLPYQLLDWQHLSASQQETGISRFLASDRQQGFDLSQPPLMRLTVIQRQTALFSVIWTYHHLLLDGWSLGILGNEITMLYQACSQGAEVKLEQAPPFKEYIRWLKNQDKEKAGKFWQENLKGFRDPILISKVLPYREQQEPDRQQTFAEITREFSRDQHRQILAFCHRYKITLNTLLKGAWAILSNHYSGQQDIVFGVTVSGRPPELSGVLKMIGCFMNTIPMRVKVESSAAPGPWLQKLQLDDSRLRQFEYTSPADIRACSQVPRASGLYDLYETILVFENYPVEPGKTGMPADFLTSRALTREQMDYPLVLYAYPEPTLQCKLLFDCRFFNEPVAWQLMHHLVYVVQALVEDNHPAIGEIPAVSREDIRLMMTWNDTAVDYPREKTLVQLFEEQVNKTPGNTALVFQDINLTYEKLNQKANQLAWGLRKKGVQANLLAAIKVQRSVEMVIMILGILKAGGAYLPIDPGAPRERETFLLKDSSAGLLLTRQTLFSYFARTETNPPHVTGSGDLAYVMYTSGTTGKPKGIGVEHRSVVNLLTWFKNRYDLQRGRHILQMSDYLFDPSVEQILGTLISGSKVFLVRGELVMNTSALQRFIESRQIDMINFVPIILGRLLLAAKEKIKTLETVISGGDRLDENIKNNIIRKGYRLFNHYGPTEITVDALTAACSYEKVTIGQPIANTRVYILDHYLSLLPIGVPGELCIAGEGVARGYLNNPQLTMEKFPRRSHDFYKSYRSYKSYIFYRTGDLARWLLTGDIEFLGRIDQQIKIRGLRIEPGEIESRLSAIKGITEAVLVLKTNENQEQYLCAYFTGQTCHDTLSIREQLLKFLPIYMVPTCFVQLQRFPLNANGKVDIKALPEPGIKTRQEYTPPGSEIEKQLVTIWSEVLEVDEGLIGINANFFELGGHSIMAMKLISLLEEKFAVKIPLETFFRLSILKQIAGLIEESQREQGYQAAAGNHSFPAVKFEKKKRREIEI